MNNLCLKDLHDDSTGFGWINLKCLNEITKAKTIKLNSLTKYILKKNIKFNGLSPLNFLRLV